MELDEFLNFVSAHDELGLLDVKAKTSAPTADEHLYTKFNEINEFVIANGREPEADMANVPEFMLNQRLNAIRLNIDQCVALSEFDTQGLLPVTPVAEVAEPEAGYKVELEPKTIDSLDDIFSDDALGLLDDDADSIFTIRNIPKERLSPAHVSRRKKCKDFEQFKPVFDTHHAAITSGNMKRIPFQSELQIKKGEVFVVDGVLVYIANVGGKEKKNFGNVNARLYCIFDNVTESNMLLRSLAAAMWKDPTSGQIVDSKQLDFISDHQTITGDDQSTGYIYILQSLSSNPDINTVDNLFKIGYATTSVEKRIANAENEPTYLMAAVDHVSSYKCFNMNTQKFESLLHTFFGTACMDIEIADSTGKICKPREWFIAPLNTIETAIHLMINGEIVNYRYDAVHKAVVERS